jgi:hypothetical protein
VSIGPASRWLTPTPAGECVSRRVGTAERHVTIKTHAQHVLDPCVGISRTLLHLTPASLWHKRFVAMSTPSAADTMDRAIQLFLERSKTNAECKEKMNELVRAGPWH